MPVDYVQELAYKNAAASVRGCRNIRSQAVQEARAIVAESTTGEQVEIVPGMKVLRSVGRNLGTNRYYDYRQVLDVVTVKSVRQIIIGTCGERVTPESVICAQIVIGGETQ